MCLVKDLQVHRLWRIEITSGYSLLEGVSIQNVVLCLRRTHTVANISCRPSKTRASHGQLELEGPGSAGQEGLWIVLLGVSGFVDGYRIWTGECSGQSIGGLSGEGGSVSNGASCSNGGCLAGVVRRSSWLRVAADSLVADMAVAGADSEKGVNASIRPIFGHGIKAGCSGMRWSADMRVEHASWDVIEEVWANEEGVHHPACAINTNEAQLIGEAN